MQNDTRLYEMPADRLVFTHEILGAGRELGEAEIVHTIWGNARVRIIDKQGSSGWIWLLAALGVLAAVALVWRLVASPDTQSSEPQDSAPQVLTAPPASAPKLPAENTPPASVTTDHPAVPAPQIPGTTHAVDAARIAAPEQAKPVQADAEKTHPAAGSQQVAAPQRKKAAPIETNIQPQPSVSTRTGKSQPPPGTSQANALSTDAQAKQPEGTDTSAGFAAPPNTAAGAANPRADKAASPPPAKAEAAKSDTTNSQP